jgi:ribosomal protein L37AE/L43A
MILLVCPHCGSYKIDLTQEGKLQCEKCKNVFDKDQANIEKV